MVQITDHFASMDRGIDMRHLMVIQPKVPGDEAAVYYERFRQKAEQLPGVVELAAINNIPVLWSAGRKKLTDSETIIWHYKVRGDFLKNTRHRPNCGKESGSKRTNQRGFGQRTFCKAI